MNGLWAALILAVCAAAALLVWWERRKTRRTMDTLSRMLDEAINGSFTESAYDESLLSAVETKLAHYLAASAVSRRNLQGEKNRIKELISDISHQTKTPIANILLYAQLLEEQPLTQEERKLIAPLVAQTEKLRFLVESLVKTSRLETGVFTLHPLSGAVGAMIEKAAEQARPLALRKGVALHVEKTDAQAVFDAKWTAEALYNLLDNAVKYTPAGGSIRVSAERYELFCRVNVTDSGIGVAEEEQSKIFTRFYRSAAVAEEAGVGVGLYLARRIVSEQGGYIKLASQVGRGSTFSLYLPSAP